MKRLIIKVLESYADAQINLASEVMREELADKIEKTVKNEFHIFGINKILIKKGDYELGRIKKGD